MSDIARTASTGVRDTYYGAPVIKAPHWRWLIIVYFFLGGLAGGSSIIATVTELTGGDRALARAARYLSVAAIIPSPVLLILDLGRPERFLNMLRIVKLRSPMSLGTWALGGLSLSSFAAAALQLRTDAGHRKIPARGYRAVGVLGLPFAGFVSGYTGVLLAATNVPLWARNYLLMGPLFVASAFSSSLAALSLALGVTAGDQPETATKMARAEVVCLASELGLLTASLVRLGTLGRPLTRGTWGSLFWPFAYFGGIVVPLALQILGPARGYRASRFRRVATAIMVLAGSFVLRTLMIFAGRESANRPEDYFAYTRATRASQRREIAGKS